MINFNKFTVYLARKMHQQQLEGVRERGRDEGKSERKRKKEYMNE